MIKRILLAALLLPLLAFGQSFPSPTFNNVTSQGTATLNNATVSGTFTATGKIGLASLAAQAANTVVGNATASSASPTAITVTGCNGAAQALQWTNGSGFGCNSAVATSGANANITSLTGLTTPLSVAQGGTGAITATNARTSLGAAASGANTDITSLNAPSLGAATATTQGAASNSTFVATTAMVQSAFAAPPAIGSTTPAAATFTTLSSTGMSRVVASTTNAMSLTNAASTTITTWTAAVNTGSNFVASTGVYTVPVTGQYEVSAAFRATAASLGAATQFIAIIAVNGTATIQSGSTYPATGTAAAQAHISGIVSVTAGQTITVQVFNSAGIALTLDGAAQANWLTINRLY